MIAVPDIACVLKGERNYAQAADVVNALVGTFEQHVPGFVWTRLDLSFRRPIRAELRVMESPLESQLSAAATGVVHGGRVWSLALVETDVPLSRRLPFDEDAITRDIRIDIDGCRCTSNRTSPVSELETWVSLNKALHQACFPEIKARWVCARIVLSDPAALDRGGERVLQIEANFHHRLTRVSLRREGHQVGHLYFSLWED
jgi:hypothetical protein